MLRQIALILPVFVAGIVLGAWAREPAPGTNSGGGPVDARGFDHAADYERLEKMISSLTEIVNLEVAERRRLEEKIAGLAAQVAGLSGDKTAPTAAADAKRMAAMLAFEQDPGGVVRNRPGTAATADRFVDAGFPPDVAARLKRDLDQIALDRLYLRDQAVREGWLGSPRYRDELRAINDRQESLRSELDSNDYDRYLYALGRPNRISVSSVLTGSPAHNAGLRPGDAILSYNGERVYSPSEIRRETSRGDAGSMVPVEILRDGQRQVVYLPRGPLGVNMSASSTRP